MTSNSAQPAAFASLNGTKIYYEVQGEGSPLVLIHAGIADSRMWDDQFERFVQYYRVVRYDVRGFGQTISPAGSYQDHQDLHTLLTFLGIERACLVGASNGGKIAVNFALTYPDMVAGLILVGPSVEGDPPSAAIQQGWAVIEAAEESGDFAQAIELTLQMWVDGPQRTPAQVDQTVREKARAMLQTIYDIPEANDAGEAQALDPPAITRLNEIQIPTLTIVGSEDLPDKLKLAEHVTAQLAEAKLVIIPNAAHLPNMEQPEQFNQIVLEFCDDLG